MQIPLPNAPPHLWLVRADAEMSTALYEVLSVEERRRADAYRRPADRDTYVAAHVALRHLLAAYLGVTYDKLALVREPCPTCHAPHGRPAVAGGGLHFSISHTGSLALLAFAGTPTGVDIERIPALRVVAQVSRSMHPREHEELAQLPSEQRPTALARTWVRKEAYLKGLGTGLSRSPHLDYVGNGSSPSMDVSDWTISDISIDAAHAAAVAVHCRT
ncbi:4'-phosphopantetheinyl transferase family protein [Streptomyces sioyaensis]|uniref:4'-phosphopantetheinyl transferase family protein n=1 Tax=Streptomyces sioyaensis TaxID=67364 RepID=UPI0037CF1604